MASPKFIELLEQLLAATKSEKVRWEQTAQEGVFRIVLGEGLIHLERGLEPDYQDGPWCAAYLLDTKGQTIDQVKAYEAEEVADEYGEVDRRFTFLDDLYNNALRSAYKEVDKVVDSMLAELEEKKVQTLSPEAK